MHGEAGSVRQRPRTTPSLAIRRLVGPVLAACSSFSVLVGQVTPLTSAEIPEPVCCAIRVPPLNCSLLAVGVGYLGTPFHSHIPLAARVAWAPDIGCSRSPQLQGFPFCPCCLSTSPISSVSRARTAHAASSAESRLLQAARSPRWPRRTIKAPCSKVL